MFLFNLLYLIKYTNSFTFNDLYFRISDDINANFFSIFILTDRPSSPVIKVQVELQYFLAHSFVSSAQLGALDLSPSFSWQTIEDRLLAVLKSYLAQLDVGLKTRRINRLDSDLNWIDKDFTLGLTVNNIKQFEMGTGL